MGTCKEMWCLHSLNGFDFFCLLHFSQTVFVQPNNCTLLGITGHIAYCYTCICGVVSEGLTEWKQKSKKVSNLNQIINMS